MTGRYHARNGSMGTGSAWGQMVEEITTLGHVLSGNGYQTAHFGKWHMGDTYPLRPEDRGFQESLSIHNGETLRSVVVKPGYNSSDRAADAYRFRHNGEWKVYDGFRTDTWFTELNRYLSEIRDKSKPFFVYLATVTAHGPHFGPKDLRDKYKAKYELLEWTHLREAPLVVNRDDDGYSEILYVKGRDTEASGRYRPLGFQLEAVEIACRKYKLNPKGQVWWIFTYKGPERRGFRGGGNAQRGGTSTSIYDPSERASSS